MTAATTIAGGVREALPHDSAAKHVMGAAVYTDDIPEPPGTLQVYIARSDRAHARIMKAELISSDYSLNAFHLPGVAWILTMDDPSLNDVSPVAGDDPAFLLPQHVVPETRDAVYADTVHKGVVQYHGQALFAVVAETVEQARAAAKQVEITYEDLPAILTIDQAMEAESFLEPPYTMSRGDAAAAIEAAIASRP